MLAHKEVSNDNVRGGSPDSYWDVSVFRTHHAGPSCAVVVDACGAHGAGVVYCSGCLCGARIPDIQAGLDFKAAEGSK